MDSTTQDTPVSNGSYNNKNKRQRSVLEDSGDDANQDTENSSPSPSPSPPPTKKLAVASPPQQKSVADDLVCPITHELPFDPVTAADGRVYDGLFAFDKSQGKGYIRNLSEETEKYWKEFCVTGRFHERFFGKVLERFWIEFLLNF